MDDMRQIFCDGWEKWVQHTPAVNLYWNPAARAWRTFDPGSFDIHELNVSPVAVKGFEQFAQFLWLGLERSWETVQVAQPNAIWSPHNGRWYSWANHATPPPPGGRLPGGARDEALRLELSRIDKLYADGVIDAVERIQLRNTAIEAYVKGLAPHQS
jgi:hypothetical protein